MITLLFLLLIIAIFISDITNIDEYKVFMTLIYAFIIYVPVRWILMIIRDRK